MAVKLTWLGHATWTIDADGIQIVVDPFLKPNNPSAMKTAHDLHPTSSWSPTATATTWPTWWPWQSAQALR